MELEEIHNCDKCRGKIVAITVDKVGITRCSYCNEVVNYKPFFDEMMKKHPEINVSLFSSYSDDIK